MKRLLLTLPIMVILSYASALAQPPAAWTFAVSGDSRNCGDFVMPVIAARVKEEGDAFYWHLGDFRAMYQVDQDMASMQPPGATLTLDQYKPIAWDDFQKHQLDSFGNFPVFLGRGNHETIGMTREDYLKKFADYLNRPEITAQNKVDGVNASPAGSPWYHFVRNGVDFITLDNSTKDEFSDAQMAWLKGVLDRDTVPGSTVTTIIAGMHEALPNSTSSNHAMDSNGQHSTDTGEQAYRWFAAAQAAGKHVYLVASHSHFYSPGIYDTPQWRKEGIVVPGVIIGSAGAHRYLLPPNPAPGSKTHVYGYLQATVYPLGTVSFEMLEIGESEMIASRWPNAPLAAIYECFAHNSD